MSEELSSSYGVCYQTAFCCCVMLNCAVHCLAKESRKLLGWLGFLDLASYEGTLLWGLLSSEVGLLPNFG